MKSAVQTKEVREAILDATGEFLARYGYQKMTIDNLAQHVGIGKGSIYLHFESKEEIVLSHIDRIVENLIKELKIISQKKISPQEKLRRMMIKRVLYRFDSVQKYSLNINDLLAAVRPKLLIRRRIYFVTEAELFAKVIEEGQNDNNFMHGNSFEIAETLLLGTNSLLPFSLTTRELGERSEIKEKLRRLVNLLLNGLIEKENSKSDD
jgi:AcrR family transcriptional regulator